VAIGVCLKKGRKAFFSEEKKQKTFIFCALPHSPAKSRIWVQAKSKSLLVLFFRKEQNLHL
jgi:putative hemolysin